MVKVSDSIRGDWALIGLYGFPEAQNKRLTRDLLRRLVDSSSLPILIMGDLKQIAYLHEKSGGVVPRNSDLQAFRDTISSLDLRDLGCSNIRFTWERNSNGDILKERLDRVLVSSSFFRLFGSRTVTAFPRLNSDHSLLCTTLQDAQRYIVRSKRSFRFETLWLSNPRCKDIVSEAWRSTSDGIMGKLTVCAENLSSWAKSEFKGRRKRITDIEEEVVSLQDRSHCGFVLERLKKLHAEYEKLQAEEEAYWHIRSRANELRDGDKNTSYFHHKASHRHSSNRIHGLMDSEGNWRTADDEIEREVIGFYSDLFRTEQSRPNLSILAQLEPIISEEENNNLDSLPSSDEICYALFQMHPTKSPGIDGMHTIFFQKFWGIVGEDVVHFVQSWWKGDRDLSDINHTVVTLIPKKSQASKISDYRPISLCPILYKIAAKTLANRLKPYLESLISQQHQSALVAKRHISDNAAMAFEAFNSMKHQSTGKTGTMSMKLDMMKAYDRLEWPFIRELLMRIG